MKQETRKTKRKKIKKSNQNSHHSNANSDLNVHKSSIVHKIRNVCDKIANSSSNVFDFDSYILSRLKYLFNTNKHLVNVQKYFHGKKNDRNTQCSRSKISQIELQNLEPKTNTSTTPEKKNIKNSVNSNLIKSIKDVRKVDQILEKQRQYDRDYIPDEFVYKLCSYTDNPRIVAAQLWHWKVFDCVRRSKVSFHNFFVHTIGAAIKKMSDDDVKRFSDIITESGWTLNEFDLTLLEDPTVNQNGNYVRRYLLKILHSYKNSIHQFNQALFSWYTLSSQEFM